MNQRLPLLTCKADCRPLVFTALLVLAYLLQLAGYIRHPWLLAITCLLSFMVFIVRHNHIHCPIFTRPGWNRSFDVVLTLLTGQSSSGVIAIHNERHHDQHQSAEDCVRADMVPSRRANWLNLFFFFPAVLRSVRTRKGYDIARWRNSNPSRWKQYAVETTILIVVYLGLLLLDWKGALLYLGLPLLAGQWAIVTINLLQHHDCDHRSELNHSRNITGFLVNWFFLNNGFHAAHHLRPDLHWSVLPEFHAKFVAPRNNPRLNSRSLILTTLNYCFPANSHPPNR